MNLAINALSYFASAITPRASEIESCVVTVIQRPEETVRVSGGITNDRTKIHTVVWVRGLRVGTSEV